MDAPAMRPGGFAGGGIDNHHAGAQFDQGVRGGEAGNTDAGDCDAQPGPIGVPGDKVLQARGYGHSSTTHSA